MNQTFRNINIEEVLFYDLELVRFSKELDINSKEFELYQKKIRNRDTDELPSDTETLDHYRQWAALKMGYNKIVCATVGKVINDVVYLRSFVGEEEDILKNLFGKFQASKFLSGFNIRDFDGAMARVNSLRYGDLALQIPEQFNDSLKKSWNLDKIIELMDAFKGSHWSNASLDEVCYHLGLPSPKESGVEGSQVSEVYYSEGVAGVEQYCKQDVFAVVNIFRRLQQKPIYSSYVDANEIEGNIVPGKEISLLERLYISSTFSPEIKSEIEEMLKQKPPSEEDKKNLKKILLAHYQVKGDKVGIKKQKEEEINKYIDSLC